MNKYTKFVPALALVVLMGQSCMSGTVDTTTNASADVSDTSSDVAETKVAVNEEGSAGDIVHKVTEVETMTEISADATLPEWETIAEALPADEGFQWVHVKGEVTNNSNESQIMDSTSVFVQDTSGNEFKVSTDTTIYVEDDLSPVFIELQPTQTKPWEGYFLVPASATGLVLVANDLSFLPEAEVIVDLGI